MGRKELSILLIGVFITSFSLLAFEIVSTRLLSTILSYHYVFVVTSLALLGLSLGALFVHFVRREASGGWGTLALIVSFVSLSMAVAAVLVTLIANNTEQGSLLIYGVVLMLPFFFGGIFTAEVFRLYPLMSGKIYGADLFGAAIGCLGVVLALNIWGGKNAIFFLSVAILVAALSFLFMEIKNTKISGFLTRISFITIVLALGLNLLGTQLPEIAVGKNPDKEIHDSLTRFQGEIIDTRWSAFGQTDLVKYKNIPEQMDIYLDGTAGSPMFLFSGDIDDLNPAILSLMTDFSGFFPFIFIDELQKENALIIGPGGGRDVLVALLGDVRNITAVEVNGDLVELVRDYADYNGGIYTDLEQVDVVVDEGRNFLKRQNTLYDIIMFSLPVTNTSRSRDGYALTENFLFTTDSMNDYLDNLTDEGSLIVVTHDDFEILKLLSITLQTFADRGIETKEAMQHIYLLGSATNPVFVLRKTPYTPQEIFDIYAAAFTLYSFNRGSSYFPHVMEQDAMNPALMALRVGFVEFEEIIEMVADLGYDISPVSDNKPFFYKMEHGLPETVSLVLWIAMILTLLVIGVPMGLYYKKEQKQQNSPVPWILIFTMLGMGFMLVEIALIQKFILFLGQPIISLTVMLFAILLGTGFGSIYSSRIPPERLVQSRATAAIAVASVLMVYIFAIPVVFNLLLGFSLYIRLLAAVVILLPLGFVMGFPFPLTIRALKEQNMAGHIPWMWAINGVSSVLGSVLTIAVAITFGFSYALLLGAACYVCVYFVSRYQLSA
jgi:MFS family permease